MGLCVTLGLFRVWGSFKSHSRFGGHFGSVSGLGVTLGPFSVSGSLVVHFWSVGYLEAGWFYMFDALKIDSCGAGATSCDHIV